MMDEHAQNPRPVYFMPYPTTLEDRWQMISAELAGETAPEALANRTELELITGSYIVRFDGHTTDRGTYSLDPAGTPAALTLRGTAGPNTGRSIPCIYQLVGDRLRICYGLDGTRPTAFLTYHGKDLYLATYRRQPATG